MRKAHLGWRLRWRALNASAQVSLVIVIASTGLLLAFTLILLSLLATHISATSGTEAWKVYRNITEAVMSIVGADARMESPSEYARVVGLALNVQIVIVTLWFAVVPLANYRRIRAELARKSSFRTIELHPQANDDIDYLLKFARTAQHLILISGDFSWIAQRADARPRIVELAKERRIQLVSYKTEEEVKSVLGLEIYAQLEGVFSFDSHKKEVKCSFLKYKGYRMFMYKYDSLVMDEQVPAVCVLRETAQSKYMLEALETLCSPSLVSGPVRGGAVRGAE